MPPLARRSSPSRLPDLFDWLDSPWASLLPFGSAHSFRVEGYEEDGRYVVRAELPGLDPDKDIEITVNNGILTVRAERREEQKKSHRSEFRYGTFTRSVTLPAGAGTGKITARYDNGILEVSIPIVEPAKPEGRRITIQQGG